MIKIEKRKLDNNVLFDYVTITFPVDESEQAYRKNGGTWIHALFHNTHFKVFQGMLDIVPERFTDQGKVPHYSKRITYGEHIDFKFNGPENRRGTPTHALELKGQGCREVESRGIDWFQFFNYVIQSDPDLKISTLHIACDIFHNRYFDINNLVKKTEKGEFKAFSRNTSIIQSKSSDSTRGTSIYFGSRAGDQINIYDKKDERYYSGYEVDTNTWIRFEVRLKNKAKSFIQKLIARGSIDEFPHLYYESLQSLLMFYSKKKGKRKDRWNVWQPWERFLGDIIDPEFKLANQNDLEESMTRKSAWLLNSTAKASIQWWTCTDEEERNWLYNKMLEDQLERMTEKDLKIVNDRRKARGKATFKSLGQYRHYMQSHEVEVILKPKKTYE